MPTISPILFFMVVLAALPAKSQRFSTEKGSITFFSDAAIEDIKGHNDIVGSLFNAATGELVYIVKVRDFQFDKALMREHFNEKYMESEKFPKSTFEGKIVGHKANVSGPQAVKAQGKLNIHGVTREVDLPGTIEFSGGKVIMKASFMVKLEDYNVKIPKLVWQNIAEEVEVTIDFIYKSI